MFYKRKIIDYHIIVEGKKERKEIILVAKGGLANRMRAIASGFVVAKSIKRPLTVVWNRNEELNAPFHLIFETGDLPFRVMEIGDLRYHCLYEAPRKKNLFLSGIFAKIQGSRILNINEEISKELLHFNLEHFKGNLIINSGLQFADFDHKLFREIFKFSKNVSDRKARILNLETPRYALQIRRTDNVSSIKHSPLELFEDVIQRLINQDASIKFFLATDDQHIKQYLSGKYPRNVIYNPNKAERDTPQGIVDAAAEFIIMSECREIFGSYWSSFSEMAALYGNTQLTVIKRD